MRRIGEEKGAKKEWEKMRKSRIERRTTSNVCSQTSIAGSLSQHPHNESAVISSTPETLHPLLVLSVCALVPA